MTNPIAPDDTAALAHIAENAWTYGWDRGFTSPAIARNVATAVAVAVCPPGSVVVSRDDLQKTLDFMDHPEWSVAAQMRLRAALEIVD